MGSIISRALEATRGLPGANVEKQAERDRNVEVNTQNVCSNGGAEADGGLKVGEPLDESAAWSHRRLTNRHVQQTVEHIGAHPKFQCVPGARCRSTSGAGSGSSSSSR